MTFVADVLSRLDKARLRVVAERQRAARAADVATRHESQAATAPPALRRFHENAAATHRQIEARHLVTAGIQAAHLARLHRWAVATPTREASSAAPSPGRATDEAGNGDEVTSQQAARDPLTGLPNRVILVEALGEAMGWLGDPDRAVKKMRRRVGLCLIELDDFSAVHDRLDRRHGDLLLQLVAQRLTVRLPTHLVARQGGDQFAILLEDTSGADEARMVAGAALAAISEPMSIDGRELTVSASVGVVERAVADTDPADVLRAADVALGWAKDAGRGRLALFDPERDKRATFQETLAAALPAAIDRNEFFLEYQPIVDLRSGAMVDAEALVRWRHPTLGVIYPDAFVDLADASGLIVPLGKAILEQACLEAARWSELNPDPPTVSVNVAARQLRDGDLVADVAAALDRSGLRPTRLRLEITEGAIVRPDDKSVADLGRVVRLGVHVAIDDFGTGYSNLSYLRRLPVQALKIDRSFIAEVRPEDPDSPDAQIVNAMVSLAHVLGLSVTAEGVETTEQAEWLDSIGCDRAQGWHFGRPTGPDDFAAIISSAHGQ